MYLAAINAEDFRSQSLRAQFETNFFGPVNVTNALLPHFRAQKAGTIIFIGSIAAWGAAPGSGAYCASKAALASLCPL
jgi:NAD(P)-dependent dehydrogenase (short-subunit alcohol dehydrogenase family)